MKRFVLCALLGSLLCGSARAAITNSLVGYWKFNETGAATVAADASGFNHPGNVKNFTGSYWVAGVASNALNFDGTNDHIIVPDYTKATTTLSVAAWVWADARPTWASIAKNWGDTVAGQFHLGLANSFGLLNIQLQQSNGVVVALSEGTVLPTNSWQHVTFVADGATLRLYRNGAQVGSTPYDGTIKVPAAPLTTIGIGVKLADNGVDPSSAAPGYWDGKIDDVGVWTRGLTAGEVNAIYSVGTFGRALDAVTNASVTTLPAESIGTSGAVLVGTVNPNGLPATVFFEWGTTTNYGNTRGFFAVPAGLNNSTEAAVVAPLVPGTTYHFRAVATNAIGRANGANRSFTTLGPPSVTTLNASNLSAVGATLRGAVVAGGQAATVWFEWGPTVSYGNITATQNISADTNSVSFSNALSGLVPNVTYHFRAVATNGVGRVNGADQSLTTLAPLTVATLAVTAVGTTFATLNGSATPGGAGGTVFFEWGATTNYGNLTAAQNISAGTNNVSFNAPLTGLVPGLAYHFRAVATNAAGRVTGSNVAFSTWPFTILAPGLSPAFASIDAAWGDYDNDGRLDLVLAGSSLTRLFLNNGSGGFTAIDAGLPTALEGAVAWGDYDGDGWLDLLLTGNAPEGIIARVYHNNGNGTFSNINAGLTGVWRGSAAWGDYDNDGRPDILITGLNPNGGSETGVYRNQGDGTFAKVSTGLPNVFFSAAAWGDYDHDGRLDVAISGAGNNGLICRVYQNNGNGTFTLRAGLQGVQSGSLAWGDYDGDGQLDLLVTGYDGGQRITRVYRNDGNGTFTDLNAGLPGVQLGKAVWGDYDSDGRLDILLNGYAGPDFTNGVVHLYRNNGDGTFTDIDAGLPQMTPVWVSAWGDFDLDGRLDFLLSGQAIAARVYRNLWPATNTPPTAPTLPINAAIVTGNSNVELRWNPASDAPTTNGAGLTYNVRVGTAPGLGNIVAPQAAATGFRRVPALGNAQSGTNFLLHNLAPGLYHWSVQAVDASFAGGAFSTNSSFTIAGPPLVTTLAASDAQPAGAHLLGQVNPKGGPTTAWFEWGPTTNYGNVTVAQALGASNVFLNVAATITNLPLQEAAYHYRVVASNSAAVARGADVTFLVQDLRPVIDFGDPQLIDPQAAFLFGYVQPNNTQVLGWFEWGTDTNAPARTPAAVISFEFGTALLQEVVGGLTLSTTYFARLAVSNLAGLTFTAWKSFATPTPAPPTLLGAGADGITSTEARLFGQLNPQGFAGGASFQWGATTNLGTVAGAFLFPAFTGTLEVATTLTGLAPGTEYYFRLSASNLAGAVTSAVHSFTTLPPPPITNALAGYWKFDETNGTVAADSSGHGNHGGLSNFTASGWTSGQAGGALDFNGADQFVRVPDYPKASNALTVAAWVRAIGLPQWATIAKNWGDSVAGQFHFGLDPSGRLDNFITADLSYEVMQTGQGSLPVETWHHVAFGYDGNTLVLYRAGAVVQTVTASGRLISSPLVALGIGAKLDNTGTGPSGGYWHGRIDELAIWNRALSSEEINGVYQAGSAGLDLFSLLPNQPVLTITVDAGALQLTWPTNATGFALVSRTNFTDDVWTVVPGVTTNAFTTPASGAAKFFRLRKP